MCFLLPQEDSERARYSRPLRSGHHHSHLVCSVTWTCLWCWPSLSSWSHRHLICLLLFLSGSWGYIVSSKPWQSQGWYSKLSTPNSKAFNNDLPSVSVIIWAIQQCPFMPLHNIREQCWQSSLIERDVFSQNIARSESILKSIKNLKYFYFNAGLFSLFIEIPLILEVSQNDKMEFCRITSALSFFFWFFSYFHIINWQSVEWT